MSDGSRAPGRSRLEVRLSIEWTPGWENALKRAAVTLAGLAGLLAIYGVS